MIASVLVVSLLVVAWLAVLRYGADSRDGQDWCTQSSGRMPLDRPTRHPVSTPARDAVAAGRILRRAAAGLIEFNRAQVDLWESYLRAQRPGQADHLHWVRTTDGWRLAGRIAPSVSTHRLLPFGAARELPSVHRKAPR